MSKIFSLCPLIGNVVRSSLPQKNAFNLINVRYLKRHVRPVMRELYKRRIAAGPEPERPRSAWANWNYRAEIFAFGKRLGEDFKEDTIKKAFVHSSYIELEIERRRELGVEEDALSLDDNGELAYEGHKITSRYINKYLRCNFPNIVDLCMVNIHDYLMSKDILNHVSLHIGTKDLVLCGEFPPNEDTLVKTLMAVIGALAKDQGMQRAENFVLDFIITQLKGKELSELLDIVNPMGLLTDILQQQGKEEPEPRLIWKTGSSTVTSAYVVGIYCDKELIGQSAGETILIAEEMAARDALSRYFEIRDHCDHLKYGEEGRLLNITH